MDQMVRYWNRASTASSSQMLSEFDEFDLNDRKILEMLKQSPPPKLPEKPPPVLLSSSGKKEKAGGGGLDELSSSSIGVCSDSSSSVMNNRFKEIIKTLNSLLSRRPPIEQLKKDGIIKGYKQINNK